MNALATIPAEQVEAVVCDQHAESLAKIEQVEKHLLAFPQLDLPLTHRFAPGVYLREIFMPANSFVIGHEHTTEHFNIILSGKASVMIEGKLCELKAGDVLVSGAGVRKVLYVKEDMRWATVHPTTETDVEKLESVLIVKSDSWLKYHDEIKQLRDAAEN